jgi:uncharacterized membrane protein
MAESNPNSRLEAFCDGVFAIALTLLVIDLKIPASESVSSTSDLWLALRHLLPSVFAFLLSFAVIFITWANHHATLSEVAGTSSLFIYSNSILLLAVVLVPFTTALLGEYLLTEYAAPAVVLYTAANGLQAVGWVLLTRAALVPKPLTRSDRATLALRKSLRNGYLALVMYALCTVLAFWLPLAVALIITGIWIVWLFYGIRARESVAA